MLHPLRIQSSDHHLPIHLGRRRRRRGQHDGRQVLRFFRRVVRVVVVLLMMRLRPVGSICRYL
jgi:hypothetical protein